MTAIEWLIEQWPILESQIPPYIIEEAKGMERQQTEISDDEIKKGIKKDWYYTSYQDRHWMMSGAIWYREQLKK